MLPRVSRATPQCVLGFQISAFEMPDAPAIEAGVLFIFEGGLLGSRILLLAAVVHRLGMLAKRQHDAPLIRNDTASRRIAASGAMRLSFCQQALPSALAQPS